MCIRDSSSITLSAGGTEATATEVKTAVSGAVMRSGRHFAEFACESKYLAPGVIGAGFDVRGTENPTDHEGEHKGCLYYASNGYRYPGVGEWEGMQRADKGDRIGMALDLDAGSMTVYKNDERLGVMQESGLTGEYVWAACFDGGTVRIAGHSQGANDFDPAFTAARRGECVAGYSTAHQIGSNGISTLL